MRVRHLIYLSLLTTAAYVLAGAGPATASNQGSGCISHHPNYIEDNIEVEYTPGCTGHDEPELDPVSSLPGSAKNMTWKAVLPSNSGANVDAVGPTFWFGGTVTDPASLFGQAFYELQFYPNATVTNCTPGGGFVVKNTPGIYTVCSPVWSITQTGKPGVYHEPAAFNAMLADSASPKNPLVMHAGDTITVHVYSTAAADGLHIVVTDLTHPGNGTIVLNSTKDGPLMPAFDTQTIGNALGWGLVYDTPNSFVWEIGHTSPFTSPASAFCLPGQFGCYSYDANAWARQSPVQIKSVTFANGSAAKHWATVSDYGGRAEVDQYCGAANYGNPFCIYPWYTLGTSGIHYGVNYPDTVNDFGQVNQFAQTLNCGGPFGPNSTYCDTIVNVRGAGGGPGGGGPPRRRFRAKTPRRGEESRRRGR